MTRSFPGRSSRVVSASDWNEANNRLLIASLYTESERVMVALNASGASADIMLPVRRSGLSWIIALDSADPGRTGRAEGRVRVSARSVLLVIERPDPG